MVLNLRLANIVYIYIGERERDCEFIYIGMKYPSIQHIESHNIAVDSQPECCGHTVFQINYIYFRIFRVEPSSIMTRDNLQGCWTRVGFREKNLLLALPDGVKMRQDISVQDILNGAIRATNVSLFGLTLETTNQHVFGNARPRG